MTKDKGFACHASKRETKSENGFGPLQVFFLRKPCAQDKKDRRKEQAIARIGKHLKNTPIA